LNLASRTKFSVHQRRHYIQGRHLRFSWLLYFLCYLFRPSPNLVINVSLSLIFSSRERLSKIWLKLGPRPLGPIGPSKKKGPLSLVQGRTKVRTRGEPWGGDTENHLMMMFTKINGPWTQRGLIGPAREGRRRRRRRRRRRSSLIITRTT